MNKRSPVKRQESGMWLYGLHPVRAALANPSRKLHRAVFTANAATAIGQVLLSKVKHQIVPADLIARLVPAGATHQGAALLCEPLTNLDLGSVLDGSSSGARMALVLDRVSDPHNVGAILRSAAALGVTAVIVQDRHAPPQTGTLAKSASGALDLVPYVEVVNIARCLEELGELGFWRVALTGDADVTIQDARRTGDVALVLGSEGAGIRRLVRERCDVAAGIPTAPIMESLNVSAAAAIALYALRCAQQ